MKRYFAGFALGALFASSALGADLSVFTPQAEVPDAPVYADPVLDWTGFYAGVLGGYGFGDTTLSGGQSAGIPTNGLLGGVTVGGNMQYDQFVYGVESDLAWNGQSGSATCGAATCGADFDWNGSLRARAGYAFDPVLVYATGGLAVAGINTNVAPAPGGTTGTHSATYFGWTVGGGLEAAITEQLSAKTEYAYSHFGDQIAPAGTLASTATTVSPSSHTVKVGLNFRY
ncbi:MAG: porin family protein [Alphaproteobacteria bacterium]|nr:porin family protein [Alphaproteobacteria bacterium]